MNALRQDNSTQSHGYSLAASISVYCHLVNRKAKCAASSVRLLFVIICVTFHSASHQQKHGTHVNTQNSLQPHICRQASPNAHTKLMSIPRIVYSLTYICLTQRTHETHVNTHNSLQPHIIGLTEYTHKTHVNTHNSFFGLAYIFFYSLIQGTDINIQNSSLPYIHTCLSCSFFTELMIILKIIYSLTYICLSSSYTKLMLMASKKEWVTVNTQLVKLR